MTTSTSTGTTFSTGSYGEGLAWKPTLGLEVKRLNKDTFLFSFQHEADLQKAFQRRPWSIRGGHLILKKWRPELSWHEVSFATSTFWVQVHGLPALWQSSDNLRKIGSKVGSVLEIEFAGSGGEVWRRFSRIQVEYEKLAEVCYNCGTIGHEDKHCSASCFRLQNPQGNNFKAAGQWLRADNDEVPCGIYNKPQLNAIAGNLPVSPKSTDSLEPATPSNYERTRPTKPTNAPLVKVQSAEAQSALLLKDNILIQSKNVNVVPPEEGPIEHMATNLSGEIEHTMYKEQSRISTHSPSPKPQSISPQAHYKLTSKPKTTTQITNPTPDQNIPNSSQTIPKTQSPTFPIPKSSSEADHPLKRKISNEEYAAYAKRLKKTIEAREPMYFNPETVTLIHRSRLEFFILSKREKKESRPPIVHGEPLKPRARSSFQSPSTTMDSPSSNHISTSS
ncbi:hypothetical protein SO802_033350 [Lithocarpus litseifolius]|uniref:CCHC-type domain-containing protein n=1 Tax=Lithocarpus litseifolius TaxID=425828 RepID=A0AAW2BCT3_9ROSI